MIGYYANRHYYGLVKLTMLLANGLYRFIVYVIISCMEEGIVHAGLFGACSSTVLLLVNNNMLNTSSIYNHS